MRTDARVLIQESERNAYYAAQRLAARSRAEGNLAEFWHWARVASEVAHVSPLLNGPDVVKAITDEDRIASDENRENV
jgi:hypothetical protein